MKQIYLTQGKITLVDDEDYDLLMRFNWFYHKNPRERTGYVRHTIHLETQPNITLRMHRFLLDAPEGVQVDHDGLNNQKYNLRLATNGQNGSNRVKQENLSSRFKGVSWSEESQKWRAQIKHNGRVHHLGLYYTEEDAAHVYDYFAKLYHGAFAVLNVYD